MTPAKTSEEAYAMCEAIAEKGTRATARSAYADGYRAAAEQIAAEIRANRAGGQSFAFDRDLHEVEVEARTLARVLYAAVRVVERSGAQSEAADAIRVLVGSFFASDDLPPVLRPRERTSGARLVEEGAFDGSASAWRSLAR